MLKHPLGTGLILAVLALLPGCEANQLYLAHRTVVGINAGVNPEQTDGTLLIGYDRAFATIIPRSVPSDPAKGSSNDAMSALVCSELAVEGITVRRYTESVATGQAAINFAKALAAKNTPTTEAAKVKDFFDCFKERGGSSSAPAVGGAS